VARDGLGLAALLGIDAGISSLCIHERENRPSKLGRELHNAKRFAIALRLGLAEIAQQSLLAVPPLLVTEDGNGAPVKARKSGDDGGVFAERPFAVQFHEIGEEEADEIERVRPLPMARHPPSLP